jgi:hypothetical protein
MKTNEKAKADEPETRAVVLELDTHLHLRVPAEMTNEQVEEIFEAIDFEFRIPEGPSTTLMDRRKVRVEMMDVEDYAVVEDVKAVH